MNICGVDYPSRKRRFEVVYNLMSTWYNSRIHVQTCADEVTRISHVVSLLRVVSEPIEMTQEFRYVRTHKDHLECQ
ncbi:hypothetical protein AAZX31_09G030400 [Glycine max]